MGVRGSVGQRAVAQLPIHRGFNRSLGFLTGAENHFTQHVADPTYGNTVDLWEDDHPAWGRNGSYGTCAPLSSTDFCRAGPCAPLSSTEQGAPLFSRI